MEFDNIMEGIIKVKYLGRRLSGTELTGIESLFHDLLRKTLSRFTF